MLRRAAIRGGHGLARGGDRVREIRECRDREEEDTPSHWGLPPCGVLDLAQDERPPDAFHHLERDGDVGAVGSLEYHEHRRGIFEDAETHARPGGTHAHQRGDTHDVGEAAACGAQFLRGLFDSGHDVVMPVTLTMRSGFGIVVRCKTPARYSMSPCFFCVRRSSIW